MNSNDKKLYIEPTLEKRDELIEVTEQGPVVSQTAFD